MEQWFTYYKWKKTYPNNIHRKNIYIYIIYMCIAHCHFGGPKKDSFNNSCCGWENSYPALDGWKPKNNRDKQLLQKFIHSEYIPWYIPKDCVIIYRLYIYISWLHIILLLYHVIPMIYNHLISFNVSHHDTAFSIFQPPGVAEGDLAAQLAHVIASGPKCGVKNVFVFMGI